MDNLMLVGLGPVRRKKLQDAGVVWAELDGEAVIEAEHKDAALSALNAVVKEQRTSAYDGIVALDLTYSRAAARANADGGEVTTGSKPQQKIETFYLRTLSNDKQIKELCQTFANNIGKPVLIYDVAGSRNYPEPKCGKFTIRHHSGYYLEGNSGVRCAVQRYEAGNIYGVPLGRQRDGFSAVSEQGTPLPGLMPLVSPEGICIASVYGYSDLYIHTNVLNVVKNAELLGAILTAAANWITLDPEAREAELADADKRLAEQSRLQYINAVRQDSEASIVRMEDAVRSNTARYNEYLEQALSLSRTVDRDRHAVAALRDHPGDTSKYERDWDLLNALPFVTRVNVTPTSLEVLTKHVYLVDPRDKRLHDIGEFKIVMPFTGDGGGCTITNLTRKHGRWDHPHVENGRACFGNITDSIFQLLLGREYSGAAQLLWGYLNSVDTSDSWGRGIVYWPVANEGHGASDIEKPAIRKRKVNEVVADVPQPDVEPGADDLGTAEQRGDLGCAEAGCGCTDCNRVRLAYWRRGVEANRNARLMVAA